MAKSFHATAFAVAFAALAASPALARNAGERAYARGVTQAAISVLVTPAEAAAVEVEDRGCGSGIAGRNARFAYIGCIYPGE